MVYSDLPDRDIKTLEYILSNQHCVKQRDLAKIIGVSLGMINAIIKRLTYKGWLMIRKVNNRNVQYIVSPAGVEVIAKRSYRYFKRTIKNVVFYRDAIDRLVTSVKKMGYGKINLVGKSDVDFIVEHICMKHGLEYIQNDDSADSDGAFTVFSEEYTPESGIAQKTGKVNFNYLSDILMNSLG